MTLINCHAVIGNRQCCASCHDDYYDLDIRMTEIERKGTGDYAHVCCKHSDEVARWADEQWSAAVAIIEALTCFNDCGRSANPVCGPRGHHCCEECFGTNGGDHSDECNPD